MNQNNRPNKLTAALIKRVKQEAPEFQAMCERVGVAQDSVEFTAASVTLCQWLLRHSYLITALMDYADLDAELMDTQDTVADLEDALNEVNGVSQVNERERVVLRVNIPIDDTIID